MNTIPRCYATAYLHTALQKEEVAGLHTSEVCFTATTAGSASTVCMPQQYHGYIATHSAGCTAHDTASPSSLAMLANHGAMRTRQHISQVQCVARATKPLVAHARHAARTTKPFAAHARHAAHTTKPLVAHARPVARTTKPFVAHARPVARTTKPFVTHARHAARTTKPLVAHARHVARTTKPLVARPPYSGGFASFCIPVAAVIYSSPQCKSRAEAHQAQHASLRSTRYLFTTHNP